MNPAVKMPLRLPQIELETKTNLEAQKPVFVPHKSESLHKCTTAAMSVVAVKATGAKIKDLTRDDILMVPFLLSVGSVLLMHRGEGGGRCPCVERVGIHALSPPLFSSLISLQHICDTGADRQIGRIPSRQFDSTNTL